MEELVSGVDVVLLLPQKEGQKILQVDFQNQAIYIKSKASEEIINYKESQFEI